MTQSKCRYCGNIHDPQNVQTMATTVKSVAEQMISSECEEARSERYHNMVTEESTEQFMTGTKALRKPRW